MKKLVSTILIILLLLTCTAFAFVGCTSDQLIGKWTHAGDFGTFETLEFKSDGTALLLSSTLNGKYESIYAWEYNKEDKSYYIWANWPGAFFGAPEKIKLTISNSTFSFENTEYEKTE